MTGWKRLVIISASVGAGVVLALSVIIAGVAWYQSRPKSWNARAIKATFHHISTESKDGKLVFHYILENATDVDYRIENESAVKLMGKTQDHGTFIDDDAYFKIQNPVFIPAKQRTFFAIRIERSYVPKTLPADFFDKGKLQFVPDPSQQELAAYVKERLGNLDGFVLFDVTNRYQINFPKGW